MVIGNCQQILFNILFIINYSNQQHVYIIDIKKVDKQLTHAMHVKDRHVNDTFIDKLTKWYQ